MHVAAGFLVSQEFRPVFTILANTRSLVLRDIPVPRDSAANQVIRDACITRGWKMRDVQQDTHALMVWTVDCATSHMLLVSCHAYPL